MSKYTITHKPIGATDSIDEEVEANAVSTIDAGNAHFLAFVWRSELNDDVRLAIPATTVHRVEKIP
jgi:hypothetical protein